MVLPASSKTLWTEKKLGIVLVKATKSSHQKKWSQAIKYGRQALEGSLVLDAPNSPRYVNLLKNLNVYHYKTGQLNKHPAQVKEAYDLAGKILGMNHPTTMKSRFLYSKLLIAQKKYREAVPLTLESLTLFNKTVEDEYERLTYLSQLYSLYGLTGQYKKEEQTLLKLIKLNRHFTGPQDKENIKAIVDLGKNYCRQKKFAEFNALMKSYGLKYVC